MPPADAEENSKFEPHGIKPGLIDNKSCVTHHLSIVAGDIS